MLNPANLAFQSPRLLLSFQKGGQIVNNKIVRTLKVALKLFFFAKSNQLLLRKVPIESHGKFDQISNNSHQHSRLHNG